MASIKNKVVQQGQAVVLTEANTNFGYMAAALQKDKGIAITIDQSYLSKYDIADELRRFVKDRTVKPPADIKPLLDINKSIADIVVEGDSYTKLENYLNNLDPADYEPPLKPDYYSAGSFNVKPFPNKISQDPRRTGRLIKPGPIDVLKSVEIQKWMINNSVLYGFVLYDDKGLYYIGVDAIKNQINAANDKQGELVNIVGRFLRSPSSLKLLTKTSQQVVDNKLPSVGSIADPGTLETIPNSSIKDNSGAIPELIVLDDQPVVKETGLAYLAMKAEAVKAGINLSINSGFRPAYGPNFNGVTSKGRNITFTTQESLRKDKNRWISTERAKWPTDSDYVFKAPASSYNPPTAPPGSSKHGSGIALDFNTGGRSTFSPLNSPTYVWLVKNSYKYGFIRTVGTEEWHFEYLPQLAQQGPYAKVAGTDANKFYSDLGLASNQFVV